MGRYVPIVLHEFEKVGLYDAVAAAGHLNGEGIVFRTPHARSNEVLATVNMALMPRAISRRARADIHLGQHQLAAVILDHALRLPSFAVAWGRCFAGCREVEVEVEGGARTARVELVAAGPGGERWYTADFLVGADGAGSAVRKALCIPFEGFTWPDRFVASNVYYNFERYPGYSTANLVVDPADWAVIARTGKPDEGLWRVAFGVSEADSAAMDDPARLAQVVRDKYETLLPGPRPLQYTLQSANPYWAHQRVARHFRRGRTVLCGDAAHVSPPPPSPHPHRPDAVLLTVSARQSNNPIGGLGLTTSLLDAAALGNCLVRILTRGGAEAADALLSRYAQARRHAFVEYTNATSIANKLRLQSDHPEEVCKRKAFFARLNGDPDFLRELANRMSEALRGDFEAEAPTS